MSSQKAEQYWPYVAAVLGTVSWYYLGAPFPSKPDALMGASGTVASVLVGFLGTAKAIILSITGSRVFKKIREAGFSNLLFRYLFEALIGGMALLVISVMACTRFRRHQVRCFNGTGGASWSVGSLHAISSLKLYA